MAATTLEAKLPLSDAVPVVRKHHGLVRITHWLNIPILLGLILSGMSIYWAAPVYHHAPTPGPDTAPLTGSTDYFANFGVWSVRHFPGIRGYSDPTTQPSWFYNHLGLGTGQLSSALNLHWFFGYLFMANGLIYLIGLGLGGGYKALLPRRTDIKDAILMQIYYLGLPFAKLTRRPWPHPEVTTKYNALQRGAYFAMPIFGAFSVLTGWVMHKPVQLGWLQGLFGGYDLTRVWHFWLMWVFIAFVVPHVILVFADGWDTFRSMIVGWSDRVKNHDA